MVAGMLITELGTAVSAWGANDPTGETVDWMARVGTVWTD
jgi:hypothetical protein